MWVYQGTASAVPKRKSFEAVILSEGGLPRALSSAGNRSEGSRFWFSSGSRQPAAGSWQPAANRKMADTFQLEIVTPDRLLVSETAQEVQVPGTSGYLGILPG